MKANQVSDEEKRLDHLGYEFVHISRIKHGDVVVLSDGTVQTVNRKFIKYEPFMGISLYGDTYNLGTIDIKRYLTKK